MKERNKKRKTKILHFFFLMTNMESWRFHRWEKKGGIYKTKTRRETKRTKKRKNNKRRETSPKKKATT